MPPQDAGVRVQRKWWWALLALCVSGGTAAAEEPLPNWFEGGDVPRAEQDPLEIDLDAEYRVRTLYIDTLELSGNNIEEIDWTEQRLRLGTKLSYGSWLKLTTRADILDGVLFGDNGRFGQDPGPISGVGLAAKRPNATRIGVGPTPGEDPVDPDNYRPVLESADVLQFDYIYADVRIPIGILRIGRQPLVDGAGLGGHDGGRHNRWGVSNYGDTVDRILFGTKLDEAWSLLTTGKATPNRDRLDHGIIWALFYDRLNQGSIHVGGDDLIQAGTALQFRFHEPDWFGWDWEQFDLFLIYTHLGGSFETDINVFPMRLELAVEDLYFTLQTVVIRGQTREVAEGFAKLRQTEPQVQDVEAHALYSRIDYQLEPVELSLFFGISSGDDDPRPSTPITSQSYPRDLNVGLLLFEHVLAFESARSAAVGIENLRSLDAESFPLTEVSTEGRFANAIAFFPQVGVDVVKSAQHRLHTRFGALFAWPEAGVVDPVMSTLGQDGDEIADDAVNFHGGDPGNYLGTELDLQIQWTFREQFVWTVEGAVLFPGDALEDEHGDAINSFLVENRFEFLF